MNNPMKTAFNTIVLVLALLVTSLIVMSVTSNKHRCNWEDCDHYGQEMDQHQFVSQWGYDEMTDGWCVEMTHFMSPELTYEQCEDYVFSGVE